MASKWKNDSDNTFTRQYGPLTCRVYRVWNATPNPTAYKVYIAGIGNVDVATVIPMADVLAACPAGSDWFDDCVEGAVCKLAHQWATKTIRGWLK